jgi:hypothetical protein
MTLAFYIGMKARQQESKKFQAGMKVPESGIYSAQHGCAAPKDIVLIAGQVFPSCGTCDGPKFEKVRTAQYIHEDADFPRQK